MVGSYVALTRSSEIELVQELVLFHWTSLVFSGFSLVF